MTTEIVRGEGHAPGQGPGEPMPSVNTNERGRLSDMNEHFRRKNEEAAARARGEAPPAAAKPQTNGRPQTTSGRIGEFSRQLEAQQEAPTLPNQPREKPPSEETEEDRKLKPQQPIEGTRAEAEDVAPAEGEDPEQQQAAPEMLDDRAAIERFRQWEQDEMFPEEMLGKMHELPINGRVHYVDGNELRRGYMRGSDSRRMYSEAQQLREQASNDTKAFQDHFKAIADPEVFLEMYERNGFGFDWAEKVARTVAKQVDRRIRHVNAAGLIEIQRLGLDPNNENSWRHNEVVAEVKRAEQEWMQLRQLNATQRRVEFERQQIESQRQQQHSQQEVQQHLQTYERQLNQLRPNAFKAYGITDNERSRLALNRHLAGVIQQQGFNGNITRALVMEAAKDLREEMDDELHREQTAGQNGAQSPQAWRAQQQGRPSNGRALPAQRIAVGGGRPMGGAASQKRGSLQDLEKMVRKSRGFE